IQSDQARATAVARAVEGQLESRIDNLKKAAGSRGLYEATRKNNRQELLRRLDGVVKLTSGTGRRFYQGMVVDLHGRILAGLRPVKDSESGVEPILTEEAHKVYKHLTFRDWFCGKTKQVYDPARRYPPWFLDPKRAGGQE